MAEPAGWHTRLELLVEVGFRGSAVGGFQWDVSNWDSGAVWSGVEPIWIPLAPSEIAGVVVQRGRRAATERIRTGTASVDLVWNEPAGHWLLKPDPPAEIGQELRLRARIDGAAFVPIFRGSIRDLTDEWDPDLGSYRVTCHLVDRKADLAAVDLPERPVEGLGDTTDERLLRILGLANISDYFAAFEPSTTEHASSNFARNLLDEAEVTVEGEAGLFHVNRDGQFVFAPFEWFNTAPRSTAVQLTWTNMVGDPEAASPLRFSGGQTLDELRNQVSMARAGGTAYVAGPDEDSALRYGLRTHQRFDLTLRYDADVETLAEALLAELKDRTSRLDQLRAEVNPRATTAALTKLLDVELGDLEEVLWDDGSGDAPFSEEFHVQAVEHRVSPSSWSVGVTLWQYAGAAPPAPSSKWGVGKWGSAKWQ